MCQSCKNAPPYAVLAPAHRQREPGGQIAGRIKLIDTLKLGCGQWGPHDLRRTGASALAELPGDKVSFEFDAGRLIISPISRRKYSLKELLAMQGDEPLVIDKAWDNMPAVGQETPL